MLDVGSQRHQAVSVTCVVHYFLNDYCVFKSL
jgi:hypothetical protein